MKNENLNEAETPALNKTDVSDSLPIWTEIHIQPLDIDDIENSKVYWIKHPQKKWSVYNKDLVTAIKDFVEQYATNNCL